MRPKEERNCILDLISPEVAGYLRSGGGYTQAWRIFCVEFTFKCERVCLVFY